MFISVSCFVSQGASKQFPCGFEHLPYPLGSKEGISTSPFLKKEGMNLTAVTFAVENGHTVAFVGTSDGRILKVISKTWLTFLKAGLVFKIWQLQSVIENPLVTC